jgi:hypothetical protein
MNFGKLLSVCQFCRFGAELFNAILMNLRRRI